MSKDQHGEDCQGRANEADISGIVVVVAMPSPVGVPDPDRKPAWAGVGLAMAYSLATGKGY